MNNLDDRFGYVFNRQTKEKLIPWSVAQDQDVIRTDGTRIIPSERFFNEQLLYGLRHPRMSSYELYVGERRVRDVPENARKDLAYILVEAAERFNKGTSVPGEVISRVAGMLGKTYNKWEKYHDEANTDAVTYALRVLNVINEGEHVQFAGDYQSIKIGEKPLTKVKRYEAHETLAKLGAPDLVAPGTYVRVVRDGSRIAVDGIRVRTYHPLDTDEIVEESHAFRYTLEVQ